MTSQNHPQGPYGQEPQGQGQSYPYHSSNYPGVNYRDMNAWRPMPPYHNLGFIAFGLAILGFITCFIPSLVFQLFSGATLISGLVLGIVSIVTRGGSKVARYCRYFYSWRRGTGVYTRCYIIQSAE